MTTVICSYVDYNFRRDELLNITNESFKIGNSNLASFSSLKQSFDVDFVAIATPQANKTTVKNFFFTIGNQEPNNPLFLSLIFNSNNGSLFLALQKDVLYFSELYRMPLDNKRLQEVLQIASIPQKNTLNAITSTMIFESSIWQVKASLKDTQNEKFYTILCMSYKESAASKEFKPLFTLDLTDIIDANLTTSKLNLQTEKGQKINICFLDDQKAVSLPRFLDQIKQVDSKNVWFPSEKINIAPLLTFAVLITIILLGAYFKDPNAINQILGYTSFKNVTWIPPFFFACIALISLACFVSFIINTDQEDLTVFNPEKQPARALDVF